MYRFASWMATHRHPDKTFDLVYLYHSRSDRHSIQLCRFVVADIVAASSLLTERAKAGEVAYGINIRYEAPSGKKKNLDFAIGKPKSRPSKSAFLPSEPIACVKDLSAFEITCEAKSTMTEHSKSKPRIFDELSSSHEIIHQGDPKLIATGIAVVNIAPTFISPLRQKSNIPYISKHRQPKAAADVVGHLRGLKIRDSISDVGFDAFCSIVIDCDNVACAKLWTSQPAPQPGDLDHYNTFVDRIARFYEARFS
jgi:hypothetical protein